MKIHYWKFKPSYIRAIKSDFLRVWRKRLKPLIRAVKPYKKYLNDPLTLTALAITLGILFVFAQKVFATSEVKEIGIERPIRTELSPIKSKKLKTVQLATAIAPKPSEPLTGAVTGDVWYKLRLCESGNDYRKNTGNGFYGAYQFSYDTWQSMGTGYERADLAPPAVQDDAAKRLQARSGWGQWPHCSSQLGLS